jgi:hypothetical protein
VCWAWYEWFFFAQLPDIFRYLFGPLPGRFCLLQIAVKNGIYSQTMLYLDGIMICRYIFIFWLKNPTIFQDDFWTWFISIWILCFVICTQVISTMTRGHPPLYYYTCSGQNPIVDKHIPFEIELIGLLVIGFTILTHLFISIKLHFHKKKIKPSEFGIGPTNTQPLKKKANFLMSIENESISDITTSVGSAVIFSMAVFFVRQANRIQIQDYNCFPYYLYEFYFRMIWPNLLVSIVVSLQYYRNPVLRDNIKKEFLNLVQNTRERFT